MSMRKRQERGKGRDDVDSGTVSPHVSLSGDLIEDILIRIPAKNLLKSKCVSQSWRCLIEDPAFLNRFIRRTRLLPPLINGVFYTRADFNNAEVKFYNFGSEIDSNVSQEDVSLSFLQVPIFPVASHNGLLLCVERPEDRYLLVNGKRAHYILCNPLTKQRVNLPRSHRKHFIKRTFLFCYDNDQVSNVPQQFDFKVINILYWKYNVFQVEIYSSETGVWKESTISHNMGQYHRNLSRSFLFNESIYLWNLKTRRICVFDLLEEIVQFIELPIVPRTRESGVLSVSSGSLYFAESSMTCFLIWILDNGVEWTLKLNITLENLLSEFAGKLQFGYPVKFLAFHPLNNHLVLLQYGKMSFLYDMIKRRIELLDNVDPCRAFSIIPYSLPAWPPCIRNNGSSSSVNNSHGTSSELKGISEGMRQEFQHGAQVEAPHLLAQMGSSDC